MGKLLDVIASQLYIRAINKEGKENLKTAEKYVRKEVPEETREIFKKAFNRHLYSHLRKMKVGEHLDYMFDCGKRRPLSVLMDDANDNLAEVLLKLPELPEGESYAFPQNSYIDFTLTSKMNKQLKMKISIMSEVFIKAGLQQ